MKYSFITGQKTSHLLVFAAKLEITTQPAQAYTEVRSPVVTSEQDLSTKKTSTIHQGLRFLVYLSVKVNRHAEMFVFCGRHITFIIL